jgi:hypothetical protein
MPGAKSMGANARSARALLRHDGRVVAAGVRVVARKPDDLLTVVIAVPVLALVWRAWVAGLPESAAMLQSAGLGFLAAFFGFTLLAERCAYHREDGIVAAHAQLAAERLAFALPLWAAAMACGFVLSIVVGLGHPAIWLAGTLAGGLSGMAWALVPQIASPRLTAAAARPRTVPTSRTGATLAASGAALGLVCALLPLRHEVAAFVALAVAVLASAFLGRVDAEAIRFRTLVGESSWRLVRAHAGNLIAFLVPFAGTLALAPWWTPAAVAALVTCMATVITALRVIAYQSFDRRIADWVVTAAIGASALLGVAFPPFAPVVLAMTAAWLARRGARQAWLLA